MRRCVLRVSDDFLIEQSNLVSHVAQLRPQIHRHVPILTLRESEVVARRLSQDRIYKLDPDA